MDTIFFIFLWSHIIIYTKLKMLRCDRTITVIQLHGATAYELTKVVLTNFPDGSVQSSSKNFACTILCQLLLFQLQKISVIRPVFLCVVKPLWIMSSGTLHGTLYHSINAWISCHQIMTMFKANHSFHRLNTWASERDK